MKYTYLPGKHEFVFSIIGNQEDPSGNPIPYTRMTRRSIWTESAQRYLAWKEYVRAEFSDIPNLPKRFKLSLEGNPITIEEGERAEVFIVVQMKGKRFADGDNILKGINDSLFENDKYVLDGHYSVRPGQKSGQVDVIINLYE